MKKKQNKTYILIKTISFYVVTIFLFAYVLVSLLMPDKVIDIFQFQFSSVSTLTESMKPTIEPGDIILLKKVSEDNIKEDDIISFYNYVSGRDQNNNQVWVKIRLVHRLLEIDETTGAYITQGDNNNSIDTIHDKDGNIADLTYDSVIGAYVFRVPVFGKIVEGLRNPILVLLLVVNVGIVVVIVKLLKKKDPEPKEEPTKKEENVSEVEEQPKE